MASLKGYRGKPIIDNIPEFALLQNDELGKEISSRVHAQYQGTPAELTSAPDRGKPFRESNPFKLFAVDSVARDLGWRVMLPEEAQLLLDLNQMPESTCTYKDLGLVMDFSGKNHDLALNLYERLTHEEKDLDRFPTVFTGLKPLKSEFGKYGLAFDVAPYTQMRTAKLLSSSSGNFQDEDPELSITGLPSKLGEGTRRLYTLNQHKPSLDNLGVVRLYLVWGSSLGSDGVGDLGDSYEVGRVVLVGGKATAQKISQYLITLHKKRQELEAQL